MKASVPFGMSLFFIVMLLVSISCLTFMTASVASFNVSFTLNLFLTTAEIVAPFSRPPTVGLKEISSLK